MLLLQTCTTYVEISLENSSGKITVENERVGPRSEHTFTINDATSLGLKGNYNFTKEQATDIFLLSCSLLMPKYYLSLIQPVQLSSNVEYVPMPSEAQTNGNPSEKRVISFIGVGEIRVSTCLSSKIKIDEKQLFQTVEKLLRYNIFNSQNRTIEEHNIIEAINTYHKAFTNTEFPSFYRTMYSALEKAANSDKDRDSNRFDAEVSNLTGMKQDKIEKIRLFNNRLKHRSRNIPKDVRDLEEGSKNIGLLLRDLKKATDSVILEKIR